MKKTLLIAILLGASFWLSGCLAISCEERHCHPGPKPRPHIGRPPVVKVVEVVEVIPAPRPGHGPRRAPHPVAPPHRGHRPRHR